MTEVNRPGGDTPHIQRLEIQEEITTQNTQGSDSTGSAMPAMSLIGDTFKKLDEKQSLKGRAHKYPNGNAPKGNITAFQAKARSIMKDTPKS